MTSLSGLERTVKKHVFPYRFMVAGGMVKSTGDMRKLALTEVIPDWGSFTTHRQMGNGDRDYHAEYTVVDGVRVLIFTLNSIGLTNPGMEYVEEHGPELAKIYAGYGKPLCVNVSGESVDDTLHLMKRALMCGASMITVNLACPNKFQGDSKPIPMLCYDPEAVEELCQRAETEIGSVPQIIIPKISMGMPRPLLTLIRTNIAASKVFDGVETGNTVPNGLMYLPNGETAIKTANGITRGGMGGPANHALALDHTEFMASLFTPIGKIVIGTGGAMDAPSVQRLIHAGATFVRTASGWRENGEDPTWMRDIHMEMADALSTH